VIISNPFKEIFRFCLQWCLAPLTSLLLVYLHLALIQVSIDWNFFQLFGPDKWVHIGMFFFLTCSWRLHVGWKYMHSGIWILALIAFGFFLEHLQTWCTSYRSEEWMDAVADSVGVLLAIAFFRTRIFSRLIFT
jgi:hypothetical protein